MNLYRLPDLLIKLVYLTCFFTQFLPHLTVAALLYVYPDSTTALNENYVKCALTLATFFKSFNHLTLTILLLVFPVSYCMQVLMKFHLCYTHYSICPQSLRHFLKNRRMQILSLFINVSLRQLFQTTVAFRFLMFYLKFWKDRFSHDLPASYPLAAWFSTRKMHCLNYLKLFIN